MHEIARIWHGVTAWAPTIALIVGVIVAECWFLAVGEEWWGRLRGRHL